MVGQTAASGTRNFPKYADQQPTSKSDMVRSPASSQSHNIQRKTLPSQTSRLFDDFRSLTTTSPDSSATHAGRSDMSPTSTHPTSVGSATVTSPGHTQRDADAPPQGASAHAEKRPTVSGASEPPSLEGIVDLRNTTETHVHSRQAPGK